MALVAACTLAAAGTVTLRSATAAGDDAPAPVYFDYEAHAGCPDAGAFVRQVLARAPSARRSATPELARTLTVRVRSAGRGLDGALVVHDVDGKATERSVHATSCDELITALAVIAAVVLDPAGAGAGADAGAGAEADAGAGGARGAEPADASDDAAPSPAGPSEPKEASPGAAPAWKLSGGGGGGIVQGASPRVQLSLPLFLELSRAITDVIEPTARLRFERTTIGAVSLPSGGARFVLTTGAVDLCPIALHARRIRLQPCARVAVGAQDARGRGVQPVRSEVRPWSAAGPVARIRWDLTGPLFAELEGALLGVLVRDRFYVEPATPVFRPPVLSATAALALGVSFW